MWAPVADGKIQIPAVRLVSLGRCGACVIVWYGCGLEVALRPSSIRLRVSDPGLYRALFGGGFCGDGAWVTLCHASAFVGNGGVIMQALWTSVSALDRCVCGCLMSMSADSERDLTEPVEVKSRYDY